MKLLDKYVPMGESKAMTKTETDLSPEMRKQIKTKLMHTLKLEMRMLSTEMQQILCDDLVTAFQNRLIVLTKSEH